MLQNEKDLLLKDLCARLPYGVIVKDEWVNFTGRLDQIATRYLMRTLYNSENDEDELCNINYCKPYLFPLSSMTEEQWMDIPYANLNKFTFDSFKCGCSTLTFETYEVNLSYVVKFINWCYKNHFDIYGLIPMGLATDATGLKIY